MAAKKSVASKTSRAPKRAKKKTGNGAGWGGPAKGAGKNAPAYKFNGTAGPGRGKFSVAGEQRMERESRHSQEMRDLLYGFATDDKREDQIRLQAASKYPDRLEGLPVQKIVQHDEDALSRMSDEALEQYEAEQEERIAAHQALTK